MPTDEDGLTNPVLESHAQLARSYIDLLRGIDELEPINSITLGNIELARQETLKLLHRLGEYQITRLAGGFYEFGDKAGKPRKDALSRPETPIQMLVSRARDLQVSWAEIGAKLGMSQQGAHKAYAWLFDKGPDT